MDNHQLSLDLGPAPQPEVFYFALRPDANAAQEIAHATRTWRARHGLAGRRYEADRLHISLNPAMSPRGLRRDDVATAADAATRVTAPAFPITFDRVCTFQVRKPKRPVVLRCGRGAAALGILRDALRLELVKAGLLYGSDVFEPHMTVLWDEQKVPETVLDRPIGWMVRDFVLVRSLFGRGRQIELERWPLNAEGAADRSQL